MMSNRDTILNKLPPRVSIPKSAASPIDHSKMVTIQRTDMSTFDEAFSFLREKFTTEMKRIEEEMDRLRCGIHNCFAGITPTTLPLTCSSDIRKMHHQPQGQANIAHPLAMTSQQDDRAWENIASSPLIQGEGEERMLNLQFDVSQFDPSEVRVIIEEDTLTVTAHHEENSAHSNVMRSFRRDFTLPKEVNPDTVISSLSRDGVLTIQAPLGDTYRMSVNQLMSTQPQIAYFQRDGYNDYQRRCF